MRLFYSAGSPFARLVRIALLETNLDERVKKHEISRARLYSPESDVLDYNPVGQVPTLELDDGTVLSESKLIMDFIDAISPAHKLLPRDGSDGWRILSEAGLAHGFLQSVIIWYRAMQAPVAERTPSIVARESGRADRIADALETEVAGGAFRGPTNAAQIVLGCTLGFAEVRMKSWNWRAERRNLSAWYDEIAARPSFRSTAPPPL